MQYKVKFTDEGTCYPAKQTLLWFSPLKFPVYPYENDTHNENTRNKNQPDDNFKLIHICPRFKTKERLVHVIDRYIIAKKACDLSRLPIQAVLYCKSIWPSDVTEGDYGEFYSGENKERVLWYSTGWWEVNFVFNCLPKDWDYSSGCFRNRFETLESAIQQLSQYILK